MVIWTGIGLIATAAIYAAILNRKRVREWYTPNWTWLTVVIGDGLILGAMRVLVLVGELSERAWLITFGYTCAAGAPIIIWQGIRAYVRWKRATEVIKRG